MTLITGDTANEYFSTEYWTIILIGLGEMCIAQYIETIMLTEYY